MPSSGIVKYHVKLSYTVDGLVGRTDIIGAIFGQTEGLLGPEMNLNELQKISKIGRIDVTTKTTSNTTNGEVLIPMSVDFDTCTLVAASIESIDKVGAFDSTFKLLIIDDIRAAKKDEIVRRAQEIKRKHSIKATSDGDTMLRAINESTKNNATVETYGPTSLPCGSGMHDCPWIILVEGRADIVNLIRAGYDNTLAIDGARVDPSIVSMCKTKKKIVAFLDGDRTGGMLMRELASLVHLDIELRADEGVEVEELTPQRVADILDPAVHKFKEQFADYPRREPREQRDRHDRGRGRERDGRDRPRRHGRDDRRRDAPDGPPPQKSPPPPPKEEDRPLIEMVTPVYSKLKDTLEAVALDANGGEVLHAPINELVGKLANQSDIKCIILDGIITKRLLDGAKTAGVETLVGHRSAHIEGDPGVRLRTFSELGIF